MWPIVVQTKELFGSEGKSQVYVHVHNLLSNKVTKHIVKLKCIVYKWIVLCSIKKISTRSPNEKVTLFIVHTNLKR